MHRGAVCIRDTPEGVTHARMLAYACPVPFGPRRGAMPIGHITRVRTT